MRILIIFLTKGPESYNPNVGIKGRLQVVSCVSHNRRRFGCSYCRLLQASQNSNEKETERGSEKIRRCPQRYYHSSSLNIKFYHFVFRKEEITLQNSQHTRKKSCSQSWKLSYQC